MAQFVVSTRTKRRFKILDYNQEKGLLTLQGEVGTFIEPYDKDLFKKLGYKIVTEKEPDNE